jgi:hypothetical protein
MGAQCVKVALMSNVLRAEPPPPSERAGPAVF